jgi:hypothetical protein
MVRFFYWVIIGVAAGTLAGLYVGWQVAPVEYTDSPMTALAEEYQEEYTLMIAAGYIADGDLNGALERLRLLGVSNIPQYVQELTERYISNSRDLQDIRYLVALAEGFGRLTPPMENFRQYSRPVIQETPAP